MRIFLFLISVAIICIPSCIQVNNAFDHLPSGIWRGVLILEKDANSNKRDVVLPFNFDLRQVNDDFKMIIFNGDEKIEVNDISVGRLSADVDTVRIDFPIYDTHIWAKYKDGVMEGYWQVHYRENYQVPFRAYFGDKDRFKYAKDANRNVSGRWKTTFEAETEYQYDGIGEFEQKDQKLTGTFLTETGDYRYLEGGVYGDKMYLSCFDGSHAFYFDGNIDEENAILGRFYSGNHYKTHWIAYQSDSASLSDPYQLSKLTNGDQQVDFRFPNVSGQLVGPSSPQYEGKPKLIKIMGTWCPNCMDESNFLIDYFEKNPHKKVDIIAVAFERYKDEQKALNAIATFKKRKNLPYEILYGGYYNKASAAEKFGHLEKIISYPTLIILDKDNRVVKILTGFSGPATSKYAAFKKEFDQLITQLLEGG